MKLIGRTRVQENGYDVAQLRVSIVKLSGELITHRDTERNGTFECDLGALEERRVRILVNAPGTFEATSRIHEEEVVLSDDLTSATIDIPSTALERAGVPSSLKWSIAEIQFSSGQQVPLSPASLTLIVGPNSAGKTKALRDIATACSWNTFAERNVVRSLRMEPARPEQWMIQNWVRERYPLRHEGNRVFAEFGSHSLHADGVAYAEDTSAFLIYLLGIEERLAFSRPHPLGHIENAPANMIDHVLRSDTLCERISDETRRAFGVGLLPDFGPTIGFRLGERAHLPATGDRASGEHRRALSLIQSCLSTSPRRFCIHPRRGRSVANSQNPVVIAK
jgi:hypothetical protein